jgi:hypothetical protein
VANCVGVTTPIVFVCIETTTLNTQQHTMNRLYHIDSTQITKTLRNTLPFENINKDELEKYQGVSANFSCIPS